MKPVNSAPFSFKLLHQSKKSRARLGEITTPHGIINTPGFVAVGTNGTIKAVDWHIINKMALQLVFANTFHLIVHPGPEIIKKAGGLHNFCNRKGPIITDSGGFQVFSLAYGSVAEELKSKGKKRHTESVVKIKEEGVYFRSYRDGSPILLTPESSIDAQKAFGADIIIPFDELPPYHIAPEKLLRSLDRTHRWQERSLQRHLADPQNQAIYAVIHGGTNLELRKKSCEYLTSLPFDGFAIGGSLGKTRQEMINVVNYTTPLLPQEAPNHLLGIGDLESIDACVRLGIDTFDCSYPTRAARHGLLLTRAGKLSIKRTIYKDTFEPIDPECSCYACIEFTRAYIHHLFKAGELSGLTLATVHNLQFMIDLMQSYREQIAKDAL